jgi:hypothetical protein
MSTGLPRSGAGELLTSGTFALRRALHSTARPQWRGSAGKAHLVRDHDGVVRDASEVERRRARMRREFGVDVV